MFLFNSAFFLLSSIGVANTFNARSMQLSRSQNTLFKFNLDIFKDLNSNSITRLASKRKKGIEDIVVDGIVDTTKKLLSIEDSSPRKQHIKSFQPKTENQKEFVELMRDDNVDIVIAIGPAGTGKTMLACYAAVEALRLRKINKIVVTRPVVSVDEEIGYLPGNLESKMDPWTRPIFDTLRETYSAKEIEKMTEEGVIEIVPLGFMRGRTFKNAWIIADEMQNSSPTQMFMLATRIGEGSKMIITGDLNQSDLDANNNGLLEIYRKVKISDKKSEFDCVRYIELDKEDVQRSRAAKVILNIYESSNIFASSRNSQNNTTFSLKHVPLLSDLNDKWSREEEIADDYSSLSISQDSSFGITPNQSFPEYYDDDSKYSSEPESHNHTNTSSLSDIKEEHAKENQTSTMDQKNEWVDVSPIQTDVRDINNDAALIPLRHMSKFKKF